MGSSYTEFRGRGFWSRDSYIEQLVGDVAAAIELMPMKERWLAGMGEHWKLQVSGGFAGWVHLKLDEFATTEKRRLLVRGLVHAVSFRKAEDDLIRQTGLLLLRFLDGELTTTVGSSLEYMEGAVRASPPRPENVEDEIAPDDPDAALKRRANAGLL